MKTVKVPKARVAALAFAFICVGALLFSAILAALWVQPELLLGDPYRPVALLLGHGLAIGFVASVLFGASYLILPVMAAAPLWSVRLGWLHAGVHVSGLLLLAAGLLFPASIHPFIGLGLLSVGFLAYSTNLMMTASRYNRWDPALVSVFFALCWLGLVGGFSLWLFADLSFGDPRHYSAALLEGQALVALLGFFWLFLLGAALKVLSMFLVSRNRPEGWSWLGLVLLNLTLFIMPIGMLLGLDWTLTVGLLVLVGSLCYGIDYLRLAMGSDRLWSGDLLSASAGLLLGLPLIVWVVAGMPMVVEVEGITLQEQARAYFATALLGCFVLVAFGLGMRVLPFLAWQLRFLPKVGREPVPDVETLVHAPARGAVLICLLLAWAYLAAGQLWQSPVGVQFAVICFIVASLWAVYAVSPALKCILQKPAKP